MAPFCQVLRKRRTWGPRLTSWVSDHWGHAWFTPLPLDWPPLPPTQGFGPQAFFKTPPCLSCGSGNSDFSLWVTDLAFYLLPHCFLPMGWLWLHSILATLWVFSPIALSALPGLVASSHSHKIPSFLILKFPLLPLELIVLIIIIITCWFVLSVFSRCPWGHRLCLPLPWNTQCPGRLHGRWSVSSCSHRGTLSDIQAASIAWPFHPVPFQICRREHRPQFDIQSVILMN